MILTEYIILTPRGKSITHYKKLLYDVKYGEKIKILVKDLPIGSEAIISCKCPTCNKIKKIVYCNYINSTENYKYEYLCSRCKSKKTNLEKYGVENVSQVEEFKLKRNNTTLNNWGVECFFSSEISKEKNKETHLKKLGVTHHTKTSDWKEQNKKNILEKYGVENISQSHIIKDKTKETIKEKFGKEYYLQTDDKKEKSKITNLEKYGVEYVSQNEEIKIKTKKTNVIKFGVEHYSKTDEYKKKCEKTNLEKYGNIYSSQNNIIKNKILETVLSNTIERYKLLLSYEYKILSYDGEYINILHNDHDFKLKLNMLYSRMRQNVEICSTCNIINNHISYVESKLIEWIKNINLYVIEKHRKILNGKELDVYIPSHNLAIEFNGLYWHSEKFKEKTYHLNKSLECEKQEIHLIHIWEDEWLFKKDIVKSIILNKLNKIENKIYARQCDIRVVEDTKLIRQFLDTNHIQGYSQSSTKLGLYYNGELISLMTFGYRHTNSKKEFELIRFCNKLNLNVIGAASKLFSYFKKNYEFETLISYSDFRLFDGKMYEMLGFEKIHLSKPDYFWCKGLERKHRFNFNKQKLIKEGYDPNKTEVEIMWERGYKRIWGCGQYRWEYNKA